MVAIEKKGQMPAYQISESTEGGLGQMLVRPSTQRQQEVLDSLLAEAQWEIMLPANPDTDHVVANPDGSITRIAAIPTIDGVQWPIPAGQRVKVPKSIYKLVADSYLQPEMIESEQQRQASLLNNQKVDYRTGIWL